MIAYLRGKLLEVTQDSAVLDVQGVGYEAACPARTIDELRSQVGQEMRLWIYTHVREDALQLFGFSSRQEKEVFISLLKVNGVGPKSALAVLSGAAAEKIISYIENGEAKALSSLPKVGKKTAEQIILTLQGKLVRVETSKNKKAENLEKIHFALVNLGFKPQSVEDFVAELPADIEVEEGVRRGLNNLSKIV
jgi:holliday junction DNA helicase RuvA